MTPGKPAWWKSFGNRLALRIALIVFSAILAVGGGVAVWLGGSGAGVGAAVFVPILAAAATLIVMAVLDRIVLGPMRALNQGPERANHGPDEAQPRLSAEQAATQAHERLIDALEGAVDGFAVFDADDRLVLCNQNYRDLNPATASVIRPGAQFEDILRTGIDHISSAPAGREREGWIIDRLAMHRRGSTQLINHMPDGRWMRVIERKTRDGGIISVVSDVTDMKRREQALEASESRFRSVAESSHDALVVVGFDHKIVFWNKAAERLFGYGATEIVGETVDRLVPESHRQSLILRRERIRAGDTQGLIGHPFEIDIVNKSGEVIPVELSLSTWSTGEGEGEGKGKGGSYIAGMYRDLRERKRAEIEHHHLQSQLFQAQKSEALGTLAGGIGHDFNNILAVIQGNAQLVREDMDDDGAGSAELDSIIAAGERAKNLVRQLLAFARQEPTMLAPVMLSKAVTDALVMMRTRLPEQVTLKTRLDTDGWVKCDATQFQQVLLNLSMNARDAIGDGSGQLSVELDEIDEIGDWPGITGRRGDLTDPGEIVTDTQDGRNRLWVGMPPPGRTIALSVRDDGPGIDGEIMARIFDPFFTTRDVGKGTGLGLAAVMGIVGATGGAIMVDSAPAQGTCFTIYLPACQRPARHDGAVELAEPAGTGHILVVDDEPEVVSVLCRMVERRGYTADGMVDAEAARDAIRKTPDRWDLLLTDLNMPGMSGIDLTRQVRDIRANLPIIICTGSLDLVHVNMVTGADHLVYLGKPVGDAALARAIRHALENTGTGDAS
ncbi:MAG: PAS domain S-box protein [Alphaproteobacteria bacterium]